jgi:antirestriction protein ArdC
MAYRNHRNAGSRPSIYQIVTDRIIASLKAGVIPWEKPWKTPHYAGGPFPRNFYTGKPYRGINVLLLWSGEYSAPFWLTFKQAQALKGSVRKGEHGTQIIFYKQLPEHAEKDEKGTGEDERVPFVLCHYTVFNVEQCDGLTLPEISQPAIAPEIDEDELCESVLTGWESRPALHLNSPTEYRAYYRPSTDSVYMPARSRFVDAPHYYGTLFHELVHSTGHESRLNRTFGDRFGDELYSKEELVAEMGAAFLCAIAGIANEHTNRNTIAYVQNWIENPARVGPHNQFADVKPGHDGLARAWVVRKDEPERLARKHGFIDSRDLVRQGFHVRRVNRHHRVEQKREINPLSLARELKIGSFPLEGKGPFGGCDTDCRFVGRQKEALLHGAVGRSVNELQRPITLGDGGDDTNDLCGFYACEVKTGLDVSEF